MAVTKNPNISAQVILKPASGKSLSAHAAITSKNVKEILPSPEAIKAARTAFAEAGFNAGGAVANSFSISGPLRTFEKALKTRLRVDPSTGAVQAIRSGGSATFELPLTGLPAEVARFVEAITFSPPPDFGPKSY